MSTENNPSTPAYCQERKVLRYLILVALATSGCMRTSVVMVGPENYPAVVADSVRVFLTVDEITGEYEQIALIDAYEEGECTGSLCISRDSFLKELKKKAGELGANGIILDVEGLPGAAELGRGEVAGLRALAIRMLTTETVSTDVVMLTPHRYAPIAADSVSVRAKRSRNPENSSPS